MIDFKKGDLFASPIHQQPQNVTLDSIKPLGEGGSLDAKFFERLEKKLLKAE